MDGVLPRAPHQERNGQERHQRQLPVQREQQERDAQERENGGDHLLHAVYEDALDVVDVVVDPRHDFAGGAVLEIIERKPLQRPVNLRTHVEHHFLLDPVVDDDALVVEEITRQEHDQEQGSGPVHQPAGVALHQPVDDHLHQPRWHQVEQRGQDRKGEGERHLGLVWFQIGKNAKQ